MKFFKDQFEVYFIWKCPYISHVLFLDVCRCGMIIKVKLIELLKLRTCFSYLYFFNCVYYSPLPYMLHGFSSNIWFRTKIFMTLHSCAPSWLYLALEAKHIISIFLNLRALFPPSLDICSFTCFMVSVWISSFRRRFLSCYIHMHCLDYVIGNKH